jgi:hypothetical protein
MSVCLKGFNSSVIIMNLRLISRNVVEGALFKSRDTYQVRYLKPNSSLFTSLTHPTGP